MEVPAGQSLNFGPTVLVGAEGTAVVTVTSTVEEVATSTELVEDWARTTEAMMEKMANIMREIVVEEDCC